MISDILMGQEIPNVSGEFVLVAGPLMFHRSEPMRQCDDRDDNQKKHSLTSNTLSHSTKG
jgi:hypothetical protein